MSSFKSSENIQKKGGGPDGQPVQNYLVTQHQVENILNNPCKMADIFPEIETLNSPEVRSSWVLRLCITHQCHHTANPWGKGREEGPHYCLARLIQRIWIHSTPVNLQMPPILPCRWSCTENHHQLSGKLPCRWSYTENHHQLPGWNSAPVNCWRPVNQMSEVGERDCHRMYSFGVTVHYGNESADQCCPTRDEGIKDRIRDLSSI